MQVNHSLSQTAILAEDQAPPQLKEKTGSLWAATCLISGTCIGGGMLAMPVQTAEIGFWLSFFGLTVCWAFMAFTGLCLVEATLWIKNQTHFTSLSRLLIGNWVKIIAVVVYLFMNYASLVAYTAGGASLLQSWTGMSYEAGCVLFTLLFGSVVYFGTQMIGRTNSLFMTVLGLCYFGLIAFGLGHIKGENLSWRAHWQESIGTFSMILATYSYQMVVPSVCAFMDYNAAKLRKAILLGTTIPFVIYSVWIFVIHGAVSLEGTDGLRDAWLNGHSATAPLHKQLNHWLITGLADSFAFLAVVTSYFGLSMALFHFLGDCFKDMKLSFSRNLIVLLTLIPALVLAIFFPRALLQFLDLSGGYGDTILSGLIPVGLVWVGRYHKKLHSEYKAPGGKFTLACVAAFFLWVLLTTILN